MFACIEECAHIINHVLWTRVHDSHNTQHPERFERFCIHVLPPFGQINATFVVIVAVMDSSKIERIVCVGGGGGGGGGG